jgi:hypothetical protein
MEPPRLEDVCRPLTNASATDLSLQIQSLQGDGALRELVVDYNEAIQQASNNKERLSEDERRTRSSMGGRPLGWGLFRVRLDDLTCIEI